MKKNTTCFEDLIKSEMLLKALEEIGFTQPTEIQASAIPIIRKGHDLIASAQTGTGKTAAFSLPIIEKLEALDNQGALILVPTRELAAQIVEFLRKVIDREAQIRVALLIGGIALEKQIKVVKKDPHIIVATPGRLTDHLHRKTLELKKFSTLILDEADRMLDMGFAPQLREISNYLPQQRQTLLFSATIDKETKVLAQRFLTKPREITIGQPLKPISKIQQINIEVDEENKLDRLTDELNERKGLKLVFVKTRVGAEKLFHTLKEYGYKVSRIHGDRTQAQRNRAITDFGSGEHPILIATDVAARGVDITNIAQVINYDPPQAGEDYIHRIGRTARAGKSGEALNFVTDRNASSWQSVFDSIQHKPKRPISPEFLTSSKPKRVKAVRKKATDGKRKTHLNKAKKKTVKKKRSINSSASRNARAKDHASKKSRRR